MRVFTMLGLSIVLLVGCAGPTLWAPGQGVAASDFEPTKRRRAHLISSISASGRIIRAVDRDRPAT